jgi:hypothetical protein
MLVVLFALNLGLNHIGVIGDPPKYRKSKKAVLHDCEGKTDADGCYAAYTALIDAYEEEGGDRNGNNNDRHQIKKYNSKTKRIFRPNDLPELLATFESKCQATACAEDCAELIGKLKDAENPPGEDDYLAFPETCKVNNPAGGGGGTGDSGRITFSYSMALLLLIISALGFRLT